MRRGRRDRLRAAAACLGLAACLGSCAPPRVPAPRLAPGIRQARFVSALAAREARSRGVEAELSLWARSADRKLPGAQARLLLAGPDAFRLRVASAFSVALDVGGRGDTLVAYAPRDRLGMMVTASPGFPERRESGPFGCRVMSAAWRPPAAAWDSAGWADSLALLRWSDAVGRYALEVGSNGLPVSVTLRTSSGFGAAVRYRSWQAREGVQWPSVLEFEDQSGDLSVTCRFRRVRFVGRPDAERLRVGIPPGVDRLTPEEAGRVVERLGR